LRKTIDEYQELQRIMLRIVKLSKHECGIKTLQWTMFISDVPNMGQSLYGIKNNSKN